MKGIDITNQSFGKLKALEKTGQKYKSNFLWKCLCKCGSECIVTAAHLKSGHTKSCGCLHKEKLIERNKKHNLTYHPLYSIWCGIKKRCYNSNAQNYNWYGGRGIKLSEEWMDFNNFYNDMIHNWIKGLTIDRIDVNGNYEKSNCRWITMKEQCNNRRPRSKK